MPSSTTRARTGWVGLTALLVVIAAGLAFRFQLVREWHVPAGDGLQYFTLSQELAARHRYAFGPRLPLTYGRLPGYPLFLAYVAVREAPLTLVEHLARATRWNVLLDLGSLLCLLGLLRARRLDEPRRLGTLVLVVSAVGVLLCPELATLACYGLSESLMTFLGMLALYLAARGLEADAGTRTPLAWAFGAGCAVGASQLVHPGGIALVPPLMLLFLWYPGDLRRYVTVLAACAVGAIVVFSPWMVRNQLRFGAPHPLPPVSVAQDGSPLPGGFNAWNMTWGTGQRGEEYIIYLVQNGLPVPPSKIVPAMYDDAAERQQLEALFARFSREKMTPAVDAAFLELAHARTRRDPLRTWVKLPLRRLRALWSPLPDYDFPVRASIARQPEKRWLFAWWDRGLFLLALVGAAWLLATGERRLALLAFLFVATRSLVFCAFHPFPVERYVVECFPLLVGLAACGLLGPARSALDRLRGDGRGDGARR